MMFEWRCTRCPETHLVAWVFTKDPPPLPLGWMRVGSDPICGEHIGVVLLQQEFTDALTAYTFAVELGTAEERSAAVARLTKLYAEAIEA
jgi:hypothetical protein